MYVKNEKNASMVVASRNALNMNIKEQNTNNCPNENDEI